MTSDGLVLRRLRQQDASEVLAAFTSHDDMARQGAVATLSDAERYVTDLLAPGSSHEPWALVHDGRVRFDPLPTALPIAMAQD